MKPPPIIGKSDHLPNVVLVVERWVRTHRFVIGLFTLLSIAAIGIGQSYLVGHGPTPLTYAFPLGLCSYSLGIIPGMAAAVAVGVLWLLDAINHGLPQAQANVVLALRLFSNLVIVAMAAVASAAARAREDYLDAEQQLGTLRADMVSAFSHDLRSPLTAIIGYTDMLRDDVHDTPTTELLERILVNAMHLDRLIGDMLSAGDRDGSAPLDISQFSAEALFHELQKEFDGKPRSDAVALIWHLEPQTPPLQTDRTKLLSVIRNLVNNAFKFTESGRVIIRLGYDQSVALHRIEVEDTGAGIPSEFVPHVFDRFSRAPGTQRTRGFGLGLFIVKRFTELLNGEVAVRSELGQGTCFSLTVPRLLHEGLRR